MSAVSAPSASPRAERRGSRRAGAPRRIVLLATSVGLVAAVFRLVLVLHGGGINGTGNYDDGVYFGAAEALVNGRLPYHAYLFLQPPGILVVLAPFALIAHLVGDAHAFEAARLAGYLASGATAALLVLAMRRVGLTAAAVTGLVFAFIEPAVFTSRTTLLEPVGEFACAAVLAVFAGSAPERRRGRVLAVVCGLLLGLSVAVKIWALVQVAVFLAAGRRRHPVLIAAGTVAAVLVLYVPFFLVDPAGMWRQVVLDQLGRPRIDPVLLDRLADVVQTPPLLGSGSPTADYDPTGPPVLLGLDLHVVTAVVLVVVLLLAVAGWRYPIVRLAAVQFVAAVVLLLTTPSFYDHYAALATPFLAVVVGGGVGGLLRRVRRRPVRRVAAVVATVAVAGYCLVGLLGTGASYMLNPPVGTSLARAVGDLHGCVVSDDPTVLVLTNRLGRDLRTGCPFWPDITGWSLDADRPPGEVDPATYLLEDDAAYQRRITDYFLSGDAVVIARGRGRVSDATYARLGPLRSLDHSRFLIARRPW